MGSWIRYSLYCRNCGHHQTQEKTPVPGWICEECQSNYDKPSDWYKKHTLPNIFPLKKDTRVAKTLRWLVLRMSTEVGDMHDYKGTRYFGVMQRDFTDYYSKAAGPDAFPQKDMNHWRRFFGWLITRDTPYPRSSLVRINYVGPLLPEWIAQMTVKEQADLFTWAERMMHTDPSEAEFWLPMLRKFERRS